jgi:ribosomal protein S20
VAANDKVRVEAELKALASDLDKAAKRGVVHQNLANRRKSRAAKAVAALESTKPSA